MSKFTENRLLYFVAQISLMALNAMQIFVTIYFLFKNMIAINAQEAKEVDSRKRETLSTLKTLNIVTAVVLTVLYLIGFIGALKQNYAVIITYGSILGLIAFFALVSPGTPGFVNVFLPMIMAVFAIGYSVILKMRHSADKAESSNRQQA